jgi:hypothetical protein
MKKIFFSLIALCVAVAASAQELPYSKYLTFDKKDFKENKFKYDDETNTWSLRRVDGWRTTLNVLAVIADAKEDMRPGANDYRIVVQLGEDEKSAAYVVVEFYNDNTFHKLLTFMKDNGQNLVETSSGTLIKNQAFYGDYSLELTMQQHIISRTSARTADRKAVKNVDESYNEYQFVIKTDVEPWSEYLEKKAAKQAKRDAKGKKKKRVDDLM